MATTRRSALFAAFLAVTVLGAGALIACGGGNDNMPPPPPPPPVPMTDAASSALTTPGVNADAPVKPAPPPVTLTPGAASPDPTGALPTVGISSPSKDQVIASDKATDFSIKVDIKNWPIATGSSHVHLILDNKPYKPIFEMKNATMKLSELTEGKALDEGQHVLVAFPSRANHESVKTKGALAVVSFYIGKKGDAKLDPKKPMLIYSRPKGEYKGEMANHVLVDFYLANETLAEGKDHVNLTVSGPGISSPLAAKVEKWGTPFYLDNLQNGSYDIKAELVDGTNKVIDGPWNSTTRSIKIDHDAPMDPNMGHGPMTGTPPKANNVPAPPPTMTGSLPSMGGGSK